MKKKKIFMIVLLIVFIVIIGIVIININNVSAQKIMEESQNKNTDIGNENEIDKNNIVEITDNFFIEQTNDVYYNLDEYLNKNIKIEGLIYSYYNSEGKELYAVVRNTPGCCGNDGLAGLDIRYDKGYPSKDTWVEVKGIVQKEDMEGRNIPVIKITSITEKEKGKDFVTN